MLVGSGVEGAGWAVVCSEWEELQMGRLWIPAACQGELGAGELVQKLNWDDGGLDLVSCRI